MVILTSFQPPTDGVRHMQPNTSAHVGRKDLGKGSLFVAASRLSWVSDGGQGFSLEYPAISLHAVSRDLSNYPHECLYLMIDARLDDTDEENEANSDEEDHVAITEIRFIPEDKGVLDALFHAMSECQTLHPDPDDSLSDDDCDNYEEADEPENGHGDGSGSTKQGNGTTDEPMDTSQFEDAEPDH